MLSQKIKWGWGRPQSQRGLIEQKSFKGEKEGKEVTGEMTKICCG